MSKMLQCPVGELAMRVEKREAKNGNQYRNYVFSKKKCDKCPLKGQCKVGKGKTHSYSITQASEKNRSRLEFEAFGYNKNRKATTNKEGNGWKQQSAP